MRRRYEFKQERYVVDEDEGWKYHPSYEQHQLFSSPSTYYRMLEKPSLRSHPSDHHHDDMGFNQSRRIFHHDDGSRGWSGTLPVNDNLALKENEHHALGPKTILRPPLGLVKPPPSHHHYNHDSHTQNRWDYGGGDGDGGHDTNDGYAEELKPLIKELMLGGRGGGRVKRIEVIQYERTYGGGGHQKGKVVGGSGFTPSNNNSISDFLVNYPKDGPWMNGF